MKIIISKIPEDGIEVHSSENAESLDISPSDLIINDDVRIDAIIRREGETFFVDGTIKTVIRLTCSRCAEEFSYNVDTLFYCHEEPVNDADSDPDLSLRKMDMDIDHYTGGEVDINRLFREQVMLEIPMHPLCRPDCLGLCPKCGQNLNIRRCDCPQELPANPFSVLKKYLIN